MTDTLRDRVRDWLDGHADIVEYPRQSGEYRSALTDDEVLALVEAVTAD